MSAARCAPDDDHDDHRNHGNHGNHGDRALEPARTDDAMLMASARRRYGAVGVIVAGGMLGLDKVLGRKPKEEGAQIQVSPSEPGDIDTRGIVVDVDTERQVHSRPARRPVGSTHRRVVKRRH